MKDRLPVHERQQSLREEIASGISHAVALVFIVPAIPILIGSAYRQGNTWNIIGSSVFAGASVFMYLSSSMYHLLPKNRAKHVFRILDHAAIFFLIAGTYTPFTLGVLHGAWGWTLFGVVWGLAIVGLILKVSGAMRDHPRLSTCFYIAMGWMMVVAIQPVCSKMQVQGILWLLAGGIAYTGGVAFYAYERVRYSHLIWHLFVIAGTACHFFAVFRYAL
jgi:hemolysin III